MGKRPYKRTGKALKRLQAWEVWHIYNRLKLAAALAGDIDSERDARAAQAWAKLDTFELEEINDELAHYAGVRLNFKQGQEAIDLIHAASEVKKSKPRKAKPKKSPVEIIGKSNAQLGVMVDGICVTLTKDNFTRGLDELADERRTAIEEYDRESVELFRCKCAIHKEA
jgi:hypothetical protein